jgi:hypothetical protein
MNYYRISFKNFPNNEILDRMPQELAVAMSNMSEIESVKQISKSTFYRIQRKDAQAFWNNLEHKLFADVA